MRVITLPSDREEAETTFNLYYTACFGGEGAKDMAAGRKLGKLQDALEAISHEEDVPEDELPDGVEEDTRWVLNEDITRITLEDAHCDLLKGRIYGANIPWTANVTRKISAAYDLVDSAEEVKPGAEEETPDIGGEVPADNDGEEEAEEAF